MSQLSALLTIRQEIAFSEYAFSYTDWDRDYSHSWIAGLTSAETQHLHESLQGFCQRPSLDHFKAVQEILNQLFPESLLGNLRSTPPESLALVSDECCLPWEWVGTPENPLFCQCNLTRELSQRPSTTADLHQDPLFLLVADTLTKQSGSDEDVNSALTALRNAPAKVINATGTATRDTVQEALYGDRFGMVYLACPGLESLEIGGGSLTPSELARSQRVSPRLVFFHNYLRPTGPDLHLFEAATCWGNSLCSHGCESFITNLWSASPSDQRRVTKAFFTALVQAESVGRALQSARRLLWDKGSVTAAAYCLLGKSQLKLGELRPMRVRESTTVPGGLTSVVQLRILNGPESGRVIPLFSSALRQRGLVIGSSGPRSCDIELDDRLPNQTASLMMQDDTLVLRNLSEIPVLVQVNGLPVRREIALCGWEKIKFDQIEVKLEPADGAATSTAPPRAFCLELHDGDDTRTEWYGDDLVTLGRGQTARISFKDQAVSRNHALLQRSGDSLMLSRLGQNVVAVNGVPVETAHELSPDDLVQLTDRAYFKILRIVA